MTEEKSYVGSNTKTTTADYLDYRRKILAITPRIAVKSEAHWRHEGCPTADEFLLHSRGLDWKTSMKYPHETGWSLKKKLKETAEKEQQDSDTPKRGRGRPKGSKNKPKRPTRRGVSKKNA